MSPDPPMTFGGGGHYTYAEVTVGDWFRHTCHLGRKHYDRLALR
ncbi:MAG: DUF2238 domain-containing protein [Chthoniobacterales bacterium]